MKRFQIPFKNKLLAENSTVLFACLVYALFWCFLLTQKYFSFGYYDWDLAFFSQASWGLLRGDPFTSLVGINYFGDHSYFFTLLTLPVFAIFSSPLTLVMLKIFAFTFSGFLLYRIAREQLGEKPAFFILLFYFLFPGNIFALIYEFNPESFAPPLILLAWQAVQKKKFVQFLIWGVLLASIKENMILITIMLGFSGLVKAEKGSRWRWAITIIVLSSIFLILVLKVIPYWRGLPQHPFLVRYFNLAPDMSGVLLSPFTHSQKFLGMLFHPANKDYLLRLFDYLLIPALISFGALVPALPLIMQHLLSTHPPEHTIYYHYVPTIAPFIFLAFIQTLKTVNVDFFRRYSLIIFIGFFVLASTTLLSYKDRIKHVLNFEGTETSAQRWQLVNEIPPDAAVVATFDYLAALSTRKSLYSFHKIYDDAFQDPSKIKKSELNTETIFVLPDNVRYALIDLDDDWMLNAAARNKEVEKRVNDFLHNNGWKVIGRHEKTLLLKR